jgi:hypothetical protein
MMVGVVYVIVAIVKCYGQSGRCTLVTVCNVKRPLDFYSTHITGSFS